MEAPVYTTQGKKAGTVTLPETIFNVEWNPDLVGQVVDAIRNNARTATAHSKDRSDVRGGGRKPWRQKGTGRARHGSSRSPIWRGGGTTFGPRNDKDYSQRINKKMRTKALYTVLSEKLRAGELIFVDSLEAKEAKTKVAQQVLHGLSAVAGFEQIESKVRNSAYITTVKPSTETVKSYRNIPNVELDNVEEMNALKLMTYKYIVIADPDASVEFIASKASSKASQSVTE
jgi:large subunit ribosomal protein L4